MSALGDLLHGVASVAAEAAESPDPPWGRIAASFTGGVQERGGRFLEHLTQWGAILSRNAATKWGTRAAMPSRCQHDQPCDLEGLAQCLICGKTHCLAHSFVNHQADAVCFKCARAAGARTQQPRGAAWGRGNVADEAEREACRVLGVQRGVSAEQIEAAYRALARKHHPDRARDEESRLDAELKLRELNLAREVLLKGAEAAA